MKIGITFGNSVCKNNAPMSEHTHELIHCHWDKRLKEILVESETSYDFELIHRTHKSILDDKRFMCAKTHV